MHSMNLFSNTGDVPFGDAPSYVVFEGQVVCGPVEFRIAFLTLFAMYYVLNMAYPACIAATLEFVQRSVNFFSIGNV